MKTIEQKAKAYDEALEKARKLQHDNCWVTSIFPELAESEDERIRKAIHIYLDWLDGRKAYQPKGEYSIKDMIAWFEKQKEQKFTVVKDYRLRDTWEYLDEFVKKFGRYPKDADEISACIDYVIKRRGELKPAKMIEDFPQFTFDDVLALQCCMETVKKVQEDKELYEELLSLHDRVHDAYHTQKPNEQKPAEWSEEDIATISRVISIVKWAAYSDHSHPVLNDEGATELIERLKSLKERYTWKPSDEQMENLSRAFNGGAYRTSLLMELYQDLKKLSDK